MEGLNVGTSLLGSGSQVRQDGWSICLEHLTCCDEMHNLEQQSPKKHQWPRVSVETIQEHQCFRCFVHSDLPKWYKVLPVFILCICTIHIFVINWQLNQMEAHYFLIQYLTYRKNIERAHLPNRSSNQKPALLTQRTVIMACLEVLSVLIVQWLRYALVLPRAHSAQVVETL